MNLDGVLIGKYIQALKPYLPAKINKIQQISEYEFLFQIRSNGQNQQLFISLHSKAYRFYLTKQKFNTAFEPTSFLMLLRKHLTQGIITDIHQQNGDRSLYFEIENLNNLKDVIQIQLHLELFGKYTNLILVNNENKIIDCLKRTHLLSNRILLPQANFIPSYNSEKYSIFMTQSHDYEQYNGFSNLLLQLKNHYTIPQLYEIIKNSETIYYNHLSQQFHLLPIDPNTNYQCYELFEAMDKIYLESDHKQRVDLVSGNINKYVKKELLKATKKLTKLESALSEAQNLDLYQKYGELLYTYSYQLKDHSELASVIDFDGRNIQIPLNPQFSIKDNAQKYFKKYSKSKTALSMIQNQIEKTQASIQYFSAIQDELAYVSLDDALEIAEELKLNTKKNIKNQRKKLPNYLILEIDNVQIFVGKNKLQNDYITNKISKKHYLWFHVKDFHGSHVVVNQSEVNEDILRLCASLAAYYSKARYSSSIPVNYCLLKDLKATRTYQVGMVYLGNYKTIYIDIDEQKLLNIIEKYQKHNQ